MTEDEKRAVQEAIHLLTDGTSNSLIAERRRRWNVARDLSIKRLRELIR